MKNEITLQDFSCNPGTSFGIGKGVVMVLELIATLGGDGVKVIVTGTCPLSHRKRNNPNK